MRKLVLLTILGIAVTLPLRAGTKSESYISYDDGGTIVRTGDDGRELDARVNLPVFPGDEVITNRRGRTEVRLADGNFLGIDRATSIRVDSVLGSYDKDANDTVVALQYGKVAVDRTDDASESFRLDTQSASYFAGQEAVFSVDSDSGGRDHVQVFDGNIEVRTPTRTTRVRAGESANIDDRGVYDLATDTRNSADDFERWFLTRTEHYGSADSRYLDRSLAYSDDNLSEHGTWTFISGFGWGWRPYVNTGWRPYFYGQWVTGRNGCMTWVSYEPWGWVPYHYGRWGFDPVYGWFWMPGDTYAPAWVYWWYSPGYIGWAPSGWYDNYRPYRNAGLDIGFGFYGRVHVRDLDLRPWTFIDANTILSNRIDRAAVAADVVKSRILRDGTGGGFATISGSPARFTRRDIQDPAAAIGAIYRRGIVAGGGQTVATPDLTPFFRRDPQLPEAVRDRIVRPRPEGGTTVRTPVAGGGLAPIGGGGVAPIGGGSVAPIGVSPVAPITPAEGNIGRATPATKPASGWRDSGRINRRHDAPQPEPAPAPQAKPDSGTAPAAPEWRGRAVRPAPADGENATPAPRAVPRNDWRSGSVPPSAGSAPDETPVPRSSERPPSAARERGSDVPRRVIDGIGGARIAPAPTHSAPPPPPPAHRDSGGGHHDSGGSSGGSKPSSGSSSSGGHVDREKH